MIGRRCKEEEALQVERVFKLEDLCAFPILTIIETPSQVNNVGRRVGAMKSAHHKSQNRSVCARDHSWYAVETYTR